MEDIQLLKNKYQTMQEEYDEMKRIYCSTSILIFKSKTTKEKFKALGEKMYRHNLEQIKLLHKIQGIQI